MYICIDDSILLYVYIISCYVILHYIILYYMYTIKLYIHIYDLVLYIYIMPFAQHFTKTFPAAVRKALRYALAKFVATQGSLRRKALRMPVRRASGQELRRHSNGLVKRICHWSMMLATIKIWVLSNTFVDWIFHFRSIITLSEGYNHSFLQGYSHNFFLSI